jgi:ABC-type lipoprotein release transport system permease subunit
VRTRGNPAAYVQPVASSLNGLDRTLALFDIRTIEQHLSDAWLSTMLSKGVASLLYEVSSTDALTFVSVTLFLFVTATAACLVPAIRAANVPPAAGSARFRG